MTATVDIRRAADRAATKIAWLDSKHSFSFGHHYDPANTHHGLLLVNNDDIVKPGTGFDTHPHRDMEIVTWVLRGSLVHQDSTGHSGVIYPGLAQRMSAGRGILHSEKNDSWTLTGEQTHSEPVHFVQMWVVPDESGITPGYQQLEIDDELLRGGLVTDRVRHARARDDAGDHASATGTRRCTAPGCNPATAVELPDAPYLHLFVPRGEVTLEGAGALHEGDAVRFTASGGQRVTATEPAEILVWEMHAGLAAARRRLRCRRVGDGWRAGAPGTPPRRRRLRTGAGAGAGRPSPCPADLAARRRSTRRARRWCRTDWTMSVWARVPRRPTGAVGTRRRAAGVGSQRRAGPSSDPRRAAGPRRTVLLDGLDQPHGLAFAGLDALRRGKRSDRRLRLRRRHGHRPADRRGGPARRPQPRAAAAPTRTH